MAQLSQITVCTLLLALATLPSLVAMAADQLSLDNFNTNFVATCVVPATIATVPSPSLSSPDTAPGAAQLSAGYQKAKGDCTFMFRSGILKTLWIRFYGASTMWSLRTKQFYRSVV